MPRHAHLSLTQRDIEILWTTYRFAGCSTDHIRQRFFPTRGARSACYTRIALLASAGYLSTKRLPSLTGIGSGKQFLTPGPKSRPVLAKLLGLTRTQLGRFRMDSTPVITHHFALCDFRLALEIACERSRLFRLEEFRGDYELGRSPIKVKDPKTRDTIVFVPDAVFTLSLRDQIEQTFVLEIDLGTVSRKRTREKLRGYLLKDKQDRFPILYVTINQARSDQIIRWATEESDKLSAADPTIFWVTRKAWVDSERILNYPIWTIPGVPNPLALSSAAETDPAPHPAPDDQSGKRGSDE